MPLTDKIGSKALAVKVLLLLRKIANVDVLKFHELGLVNQIKIKEV